VIALLSALTLLACTLGVPLPTGQRVAKQTDQPYPCMDSPCGCANAEMCWRNCCCHTQQEKVAWARKNNVVPPSYVLAAAKAELKIVSQNSPKCCCCKEKSYDAKPRVAPVTKPSTTKAVMFQALKCQGLGVHWIFAPLSLSPIDETVTLQLLPLETVAMATFSFSSYLTPPSTPPPKFL